MKQKHMFSLLDNTYTTVKVVFGDVGQDPNYYADKDLHGRPKRVGEPSRGWNSDATSYTYKVPLAWGVNAGDELLVESKRGLAIVTVVTVDAMPDIDVDANFDYKWAVQRIDRTEYNTLVEREKNFGNAMVEIERVKQRESLLESFRNSLPEGSAARTLFEQTTATLTPPAPPPAPAPDFPMGAGQAGMTGGNS